LDLAIGSAAAAWTSAPNFVRLSVREIAIVKIMASISETIKETLSEYPKITQFDVEKNELITRGSDPKLYKSRD
jgi:hypothetical protein